MSKMTGWAAAVACLVLTGALAVSGSVARNKALPEDYVKLTAASQNAAISSQKVREIRESLEQEQKKVDFTAWREVQAQTIFAPAEYKTAIVTVCHLNGSSEYVIPYGKSLKEGDEDGCLIGAETAYRLFGSTDVEGLTVTYQNKDYRIRGVIGEPSQILIVEEQEESALFMYLSMCTYGEIQPENFLNRYGLDFLRISEEKWWKPSELLKLVPGKWSDFDGWKNNIEKERSVQKALKSRERSVFE